MRTLLSIFSKAITWQRNPSCLRSKNRQLFTLLNILGGDFNAALKNTPATSAYTGQQNTGFPLTGINEACFPP